MNFVLSRSRTKIGGTHPYFFSILKTPRMTSAHSPTATYVDCTYTITLFRENKNTQLVFGEHMLTICACPEDDLPKLERVQIKGPCADDGILYYIYAEHYDFGGAAVFVWLKDKEEALALNRELRVIQDAENEKHGL
jgi:hypothetical protein